MPIVPIAREIRRALSKSILSAKRSSLMNSKRGKSRCRYSKEPSANSLLIIDLIFGKFTFNTIG